MKYKILTEKDIYKGNLILVNAETPVKSGENVILSEAAPNVFLQREAAFYLTEALRKIGGEDGIVLVSGFRSRREQSEIYKMSLSENGEDFTRRYVALPDCSEHQTGLAIDLGLKSDEVDFIRPDFPFDGICGEFRKIASDFGFVLRYPKEKEKITGISFEPWHFRYVGTPHSVIMEKLGLALEEYVDFIKGYGASERLKLSEEAAEEVFYVPFDEKAGETKIPFSEETDISGNNRDGFIVTVRGV